MQLSTFRNYLLYERRFSEHTVKAYLSDIDQFGQYLDEVYQLTTESEIKHFHIRSWMVSLLESGMAAKSVNRKLSSLRTYYRFLRRRGAVNSNPFNHVVGPKTGKRLPEVVEQQRIDLLLEQIEFPTGFPGFRDRLVIDLLYSTGMRRAELIALKLDDIDLDAGVVKVFGKGGKERLIPIGARLSSAVEEYAKMRKDHLDEKNLSSEHLIITDRGNKTYPKFVYNVVRKYLGMVTSNEHRGPHTLRHSFATHLAEEGADINAIKELMGHSSLAATQIYTHTSMKRLKDAYDKAHPKAK